MKSRWTQNLGLKFLSLIAAVIIWLVIVSAYDPAITADFTLDVEILNEDAIASLGKVYEVVEGNTVNIRVKGNSSQVKSLRASDFKATADISRLSPTYHASINVTCKKTNNLEISFLGKVDMLAIRLEDIKQKQVKVVALSEGRVADGFYVGTSTPKPNQVTVSGAESAIERINEVRVVVDVTDATENFRTKVEPRAYDAEGNEITTGNLTFSKSPITVSTIIYGTKEVPILIRAEGTVYNGYRLIGVECDPKTVVLAGSEEALALVDEVVIPISVDSRITSLEETVMLADYIPDNVYLNDGTASVNITAEIEKLMTKTYKLSYESIQFRNADYLERGYQIEATGEFAVKVQGRKDELEQLETISLRPYVDVSELTEEGVYSVPIRFELEERFEVKGKYVTSVRIIPKPVLPPEEEDPEDREPGEGDENGGEEGAESGLPGEEGNSGDSEVSEEENGSDDAAGDTNESTGSEPTGSGHA